MVNPKVFKAYDIRGLVDVEVNAEAAYAVGRAVVQFTGAKRVAVGHDMRPSSLPLREALVRGLNDAGADAHLVGMMTTPMFYFATAGFDRHDAGVMVTASHNPAAHNGFKLCFGDGMPISAITGMSEIARLATSPLAPVSAPTGTIEITEGLNEAYLDKLETLISFESIPKLKVVIDAGNGMAGEILPALSKRLPQCEIVPLYWELDGNFPNHEANPLKTETLAMLQQTVREKGAHVGVAFDGDADRVGFVDERGEIIRGDNMTALLSQVVLGKYPGGRVLYDVRSTRAIAEAVTSAGGTAEMSRVGHGLIKKQMREEGAVFAGELSAHYYFKDFYTAECSDLVMLMIMQYMGKTGKKISDLVAPFCHYAQSGEINFTVADAPGLLTRLEADYGHGPGVVNVTTIDGVRVDFADWWFSVRASNTEPLVRLNVEATDRATMEQKVKELSGLVTAHS